MMRTTARRLCGQVSGGPSGVRVQSSRFISAPTSPPRSNERCIPGPSYFGIAEVLAQPEAVISLQYPDDLCGNPRQLPEVLRAQRAPDRVQLVARAARRPDAAVHERRDEPV